FFESNGWDKDADRNTFEARQMEPLPFRAMGKYGDPFPDTPEMREYRERWLTREVWKSFFPPPERGRPGGGVP
ncbi:MAG: hypothetical protein ABIS20_10035, partial [Thermoanaerobaculia bacterium]